MGERELFFGKIWDGIKNAATNIGNGVKGLFDKPESEAPASESEAPADDDRQLIKYVSKHFNDLTEDNRELLLGTLASVAVPLLSSLLGGRTEDDRELGFWSGFEKGLGDVASVAGDLAPLLIAAKMDDRQLVLNKDQIKKLSRDVSDFSDDERERFFGKIWNGIKNAGANIWNSTKDLFTSGKLFQKPAAADDDRE